MLWAYVDESGRHDKTNGNRYTHLGVGGALAELGDWKRLSRSWRRSLDDEGLCQFHMVDFEHGKGEFKGWSQERRYEFLNRLLTIIMDNRIVACVGVAINAPQAQKGRLWFPPIYKSCVKGLAIRIIREVDRMSKRRRRVHIVFAQHQEIRLGDLAVYFDAVNRAAPYRVTVSTGNPRTVIPLQVADLVIYETLRASNTASPTRYPLRYLKEHGMPVLLDQRIQT